MVDMTSLEVSEGGSSGSLGDRAEGLRYPGCGQARGLIEISYTSIKLRKE